MHNVRWDDLQFVHSVAEHGSLSAASRALGVNHATVLRRIALLEANANVVLFDRGKDGYRLRPEGRALLGSLKLMEDASAKISRKLSLSSKGIDGTFRIATTDTIACLLLPEYLGALREAHPDVRIEICVSNNLVDMARSPAEILIRSGPKLPPELFGSHAGRISFGVFGSADYLADNTHDRVEDHKWVGVTPNFAKTTVGDWQFSSIRDNYEISADSFMALASLAEQGFGLAMLPAFLGRHSDRLLPATQFAGGPVNEIWVATHRDFLGQKNIEALLDFLADAFRADAARLE
ncbi:MAG: LysR family transcriptional regulator [Roseibium sp.]|uniref:LysR family transcriptional regulator n=1 Tax=Roseibium sp. TaxID=1936156 RepID=UPI001AFE2B2C|nr:LysR family transcriptional regulator [Roseibium sp.]MBO6894776.1 LysR family transcriptional regulator [Roseibium sp.]MBO6929417.1 LysR family transcriptional regulator [Roseibium sp.]